jgi:hypothetical protein
MKQLQPTTTIAMNEIINSIITKAEANAKERLELIEATKHVVETFALKTGDGFSKNFLKKLMHFPGDITTHRIATELSKLKA